MFGKSLIFEFVGRRFDWPIINCVKKDSQIRSGFSGAFLSVNLGFFIKFTIP
jgi:hypothetical protein